MPVHRELSYLGAEPGTGNIWIPLDDVTAELDNGRLALVEGSERPFGHLTGLNTPSYLDRYYEQLRTAAQPIDTRVGQALIYPSCMLHCSEANRSDQPRVAVAAAVAPADAQLYQVEATGRSGRLLHAVPRGFIVETHPEDLLAGLEAGGFATRAVTDDWSIGPEELAAAIPCLGEADSTVAENAAVVARPAPRWALPDHEADVGAPPARRPVARRSALC